MFCGKCGAQNADDAMLCTGCGAKLNGDKTEKSETTAIVKQNDKNRKTGMIAVIIGIVVVVGIVIALFGGRSYETTVEKLIDAQYDADIEAVIALIPEEVLTYALEEEGYNKDDIDEFIEESEEEIQAQLDYLEQNLGEDWKITHEIVNIEDVVGGDLDDLADKYEDIDVKISDAKTVEVKLTVKAGETEGSDSLDVPVIKIGRSWYLDVMSMGGII